MRGKCCTVERSIALPNLEQAFSPKIKFIPLIKKNDEGVFWWKIFEID